MKKEMLATAKTVRPAAEVAPASPADVMLTKEELAAKLKVSVRSIENWQHAGYLPFIKVANVVMFYWPTVLTHLQTHYSVSPVRAARAIEEEVQSPKSKVQSQTESLPHPGPLPPAAAGRRGSRDSKGASL